MVPGNRNVARTTSTDRGRRGRLPDIEYATQPSVSTRLRGASTGPVNPKRLIPFVLLGVLVVVTIFWVPGRFADSSAGKDGGHWAGGMPSA